jgi:choice-of-anchor B domain-containing protein
MARAFLADAQPAADLQAQSATTCTDGSANGYPCSNIDLLSFLPLADIGGGKGNDIWGWTDPSNGREYAIMGRTTGTAFVDITNPESPVYLGNLPTTRFSSTWRDIKVSGNYAYIVSESRNHGMQVFDLTRLRGLAAPVTFSADALYTGFATAHNIFINEDSRFAYAIGSNTCSGGLHMVDIQNPLSPTQAGCFSADGYTHDVQCVNSTLAAYAGRELCFASNEDTLTVVDVTDKSAPVQLARVPYEGASYTHQGWLTDDQQYFLIDDEADEGKGFNTRTYVFDVSDPANAKHIGTHAGTNPAIDHNQYIVGNHSFQANYRSGLRILDITGVATATLSEVAYFDIYPADNAAEFNGAWSVYPFFASGNVVVSGIEQGLFVLRPNLGGGGGPNDSPTASFTYVCSNLTCTFDGSGSTDADGTISTYAWDFGDGKSGSGATVEHSYSTGGTYMVVLTVTDNDGDSANTTRTLQIDGPTATMHVGDLDGTRVIKGKSGRWEASVTITVHDGFENPVAGATVSGTWSGASTASASGTTGSDGTLTLSTGTMSGGESVTFTVTGAGHATLTYAPSDNHDPDEDSDGTAITVTRT